MGKSCSHNALDQTSPCSIETEANGSKYRLHKGYNEPQFSHRRGLNGSVCSLFKQGKIASTFHGTCICLIRFRLYKLYCAKVSAIDIRTLYSKKTDQDQYSFILVLLNNEEQLFTIVGNLIGLGTSVCCH